MRRVRSRKAAAVADAEVAAATAAAAAVAVVTAADAAVTKQNNLSLKRKRRVFVSKDSSLLCFRFGTFLSNQFQNAPKTRIFRPGKIAPDTERLFSQFLVVNCNVYPQTWILLRVEAVERRRRQEYFQPIAAPAWHQLKRHRLPTHGRCILQSAIDLALHECRFVLLRPASGSKEMELMAVAAGSMACACIARVNPDRRAVGEPRPRDIANRRLFLAAHFHLQGQSAFVPGYAHIRERTPLVHGGKTVEPAHFRQIEQIIIALARQLGDVPTGIANAEEKAIRNQRH